MRNLTLAECTKISAGAILTDKDFLMMSILSGFTGGVSGGILVFHLSDGDILGALAGAVTGYVAGGIALPLTLLTTVTLTGYAFHTMGIIDLNEI